jgi:hypothetical protein
MQLRLGRKKSISIPKPAFLNAMKIEPPTFSQDGYAEYSFTYFLCIDIILFILTLILEHWHPYEKLRYLNLSGDGFQYLGTTSLRKF